MTKTTHIICILDRSGSMGMMAAEVISNFNNFLKEQQALEGKAKMTLVLFDDKYEVLYDEVKLSKVKPLTIDQYYARGMTSMMDAIGKTINDKMDKKKAIVLIHTDGAENSSKEFTRDGVKSLVTKMKEKWEFIFVGADMDASVGHDYGFNNNIQTVNSAVGLADSYGVFNASTVAYRSAVTEDKDIDMTAVITASVNAGTTTKAV